MIQRRTLLRGLSVSMSLPWLESLTASTARAAATNAEASAHPTRMAFVYAPNGVIKDKWTPSEVGTDFDLSPTLQPLKSVKEDLIVFTNLS